MCLEREWILAKLIARLLEERHRRGDALAVVILGRRLAVADLPAGGDLHPDDLDLDVRGAGDPEGRGQRQRGDFEGQLHLGEH